ncbi:GMC oxidoreductase [Streptomyces djakartensis]|uniref:Oxidoreductase n=1 Tax=Streptomyces djakartensis TaxID=68193 RepID=A0ABQ2ZKH1_9ACTN|nr:GMC family oxidoreductase [Streptomyces djakartensis]GGY15940.1 oxidoreductase [Streptomyces djakartensis]
MTEDDTPHAYDAVVVGSGFAGSWAAKELTESGLHVLVLEAGPPRSADEVPDRFVQDQGQESGRHARQDSAFRARHGDDTFAHCVDDPGSENGRLQMSRHVQARHPAFASRGPHLFVDDAQHPYQTPRDKPFFWIRGMQVGGRSLTWGGSAMRLSRYELEAPELDDCALSWPVRSEELADAYTLVEEFTGLHGSTEGLEQLPDSVYRNEPFALTPAEKDFQEAYRRPNTHPVPVRFIPSEREHHGWPGYTMQATALAAAESTGRLVLRPHALVTEVTVAPETGLATGVRYVDVRDGSRHRAQGRVVFLCGGTIETTRLMLNSHNPRHPAGLGNSSGWLGRGLMDHPLVTAAGVLDDYPHVAGYEWSARQRGLLVPPQPGGKSDVRPFGMWVTLQRLSSQGRALGSIDAQGEMLPYRKNRIRLSDARDQWGMPLPVIECAYGPHEERLYTAMRRGIEQAAALAGLRITALSEELTAPGLNAHDLGTARMGASADSSVVDSHNRCWDCPNVYVTGGACFPSGGWQNPTLTIMALSARAGRHAAHLLKKGSH